MLQHLFISIALIWVSHQKALAYNDSSQVVNPQGVKRIYGSLHMGFGYKHLATGTTHSIIFKNTWGIGYSFLANIYSSAKLPKDYEAGSNFIFPADPVVPGDKLLVHSLLLHKEFYTSDSYRTYGVFAGPSLNYYYLSSFKRSGQSFGLISYSGNYKISMNRAKGYGFTLGASIGFLRSTYSALQLCVVGNINGTHSYGLIQLEMLFGKIRER